MSETPGPILVYDGKHRGFRLQEDEETGKNLSRLLNILRSYKPELASELLRALVTPVTCKIFLEFIPKNQYLLDNFDPPVFIGIGGFGTVYKSRHKIDGKIYAIKKISGSRSRDALELARSEVYTMSRLRHINVVRYITSWLDYEWVSVKEENEGYPGNTTSQHCPKYYLTHTSSEVNTDSGDSLLPGKFYDACRLTDKKSRNNNERLNGKYNKKKGRNTSKLDTTITTTNDETMISSKQIVPVNNFKTSHPAMCIRRPVLCIQLELCQYNLADWLQYRNNVYRSASTIPSNRLDIPPFTTYETMQRAPVRWLMDQMASGIAYLHSENVIHRDLKPENVLICGPPLHAITDIPCTCTTGKQLHNYLSENATTTTSTNVNSNEFHSSSVKMNCYHQLIVKICDFGLARILLDDSIHMKTYHVVTKNYSDNFHLYDNKKILQESEYKSRMYSSPQLHSTTSNSLSSSLSNDSYPHRYLLNDTRQFSKTSFFLSSSSSPSSSSSSLTSSTSSSKTTDSDSLIQFKNPSGNSSNNLSEHDQCVNNSLDSMHNKHENQLNSNGDYKEEAEEPSTNHDEYPKNGISDEKHLPLSTYNLPVPTPTTGMETPTKAPIFYLTANLGSSIYTAPEVQYHCGSKTSQRTFYDYKVDIYSLGVIYFEMLHPCFTKSELINYLEEFVSNAPQVVVNLSDQSLNNHTDRYASNFHFKRGGAGGEIDYLFNLFPRSMQTTWPYESHLVARMLNLFVQYRPSANEIVEILSVNSEIPDLRRNYVGSGYSIPTTTNFPPTSSTNSSSSQKLKNQQQQPLDDGINGNATGEETDQPVKDNFSNYQLIDYLIWRNRELEQELCEIRQRLSQYEKC